MKIIKERGSFLRSGTSYILRPDDVHIEFNATPDKVQAVADRLRNGQSSAPEVKPAASKPPGDRATATAYQDLQKIPLACSVTVLTGSASSGIWRGPSSSRRP